MSRARVAITGIGVVSPYGIGRDVFWDHVTRGVSGTRAITGFDASHLPCRVAAVVPDELVTVTAPAEKPAGPKRFYLGGQVYEGWTNVPDRYKVLDSKRTMEGTQIVPLFSFKW